MGQSLHKQTIPRSYKIQFGPAGSANSFPSAYGVSEWSKNLSRIIASLTEDAGPLTCQVIFLWNAGLLCNSPHSSPP